MKICPTLAIAGLFALVCTLQASVEGERMVPLAKSPPNGLLRSLPLGSKQLSEVIHLSVSLNFGNREGMAAFVDRVSDPKSPSYRHFIGPDEVGRRFGLPATEVAKVSAYLKSQGMIVRFVGKNRLSMLVNATVGQAQSAFNTSIQRYLTTPTSAGDNGLRYSFTTPPELPANIAPDVVDISGLENFTRPKPRSLSPVQLQGLYSVAPLSKHGSLGQGRTIAISNWDGFRISNEVLECTNFNLPVPKAGAGTNITVKVVDDGNGLEGPEYGEGDLDIQSTIAMAPLCNLIVYDNDEPSGDADYIGVLSQEADDNSADVITESYGWFLDIPTALAAHNLHVSMSAQGITYLAASGDSGTTLDYAYPDIDPEILSVGGTSATVNSENLRLTEVGWNSDGGAGGGGWVDSLDTFNIRPAYQSTPAFLAWSGVPSIKSVPYRLIPDIALNADPNTGFYVWFPGGYQVFGGTSGASPTCAGSLGITEQQLISDGFLPADSSGHSRFGRIQDLLYSYNGDPSVFFDVVSGTNGALPNGAVSVAVPGWDTDSGWGPIIFAGLVAKIEGIPEVSTLKLSNSAISGGVSVTGTLTLSFPASKGGTTVELLSSGPDVQVPSSVTVPAGATTISFPVTSNGVAHGETLTISASNAYGLESANLSIFPATYTGLSLSAAAVAGGNTVTGTISLSGAAPPGGFVIDLTSSSSAAKVPSTVTVPANSSSVNFSIATSPIMSNTSATISGESSNTATFSQTLGIQTATVQSVTLSSASVVGGSTSVLTGTIVLDGPALPSGDEVSLLSSNSKLATVNKTVKVMAGATTVSFTVDHFVTATSGETSITARFNGVSQTATVSVVPFQLSSLTVTPTAVNGGVSSTGSVTLNAAPGPHSGVVSVKLQSSSKLVTVPTSITVPTGSATGSFTVKTAGVGSTTSATITASYKSSTESVSISVNPTVLASISATPGVVKGSSTTKVVGTVSLNGVAPSGGFVIHLSSSDPSAAGVASIVTVPAGKTSVTFAISHKKIASQEVVSLTATANGMTEATTLTITP